MQRIASMMTMLTILGLSMVQVGCDGKRNPSILVIAVDHLPFHLSLCTRDVEETERSGFQILCDESIRYTHATTTSTLSVPALASMMTGLVPEGHGVHHNGSPGLAAAQMTFPELAVQKGYRTAFFSGGAPVWRKSGLHQGFENFDDQLSLSTGHMFRHFTETSELFFQWLENEVGDAAFLSVLYVPDLAFVDTVTETSVGDNRSQDEESQVDDLDESLAKMIHRLKKSHRWDDTIVIVTGLNGRKISPRDHEIEPLLLNSENTQVSLFIKPQVKPRDQALSWKIDRNVSLADVGRTIFELLDESWQPSQAILSGVSLASSLKSAKADWDEDRPIPVESGWAQWQGWGPVRNGAFRGHDLVLYQTPILVFNSLVDRIEIIPQPLNTGDHEIVEQWQKQGAIPWPELDHSHLAIFEISPLNWLSPSKALALHRDLQNLAKAKNADERTLRWAAQSALEQRDWAALLDLGRRANIPSWIAVAERNRGHMLSFKDSCLDLLGQPRPDSKALHDCNDELFLDLYAYIKTGVEGENHEIARKKFLKAWEMHQLDLRILKANAGLGLLWLPVDSERILPSLTGLALALPELKRFSP